jgi:hypothetical protein
VLCDNQNRPASGIGRPADRQAVSVAAPFAWRFDLYKQIAYNAGQFPRRTREF